MTQKVPADMTVEALTAAAQAAALAGKAGVTTGTWTPSVGGTATYNSQIGYYVKLDRMVFVTMKLHINVIGTGTTGTITGLPFTNRSNDAVIPSPYFVGLSANVVAVSGLVAVAGTSITLVRMLAAAASYSSGALLTNGSAIWLAGCYLTD